MFSKQFFLILFNHNKTCETWKFAKCKHFLNQFKWPSLNSSNDIFARKKPHIFYQDKQNSILFTRELIQNIYFILKPWVTSHFMCSMLIKKKKQIAWPGSSMHVVYECIYLHSWLHSMSKTKEWDISFLDVHYNLFFFFIF